MLQKVCHFNSRLSFEMGPRRKCQISPGPPEKNSGEVMANPLVSKNGPFLISNRGSKLTKY